MPNFVEEYTIPKAQQYIKLMPQLRNDGLHILNKADIIRKRVRALEDKDLNLVSFWLDRYFDTPDGFAYPRKNSEFSGSFKFVPDSELLLNVNNDTEPINGALELPDDEAYANLAGYKFRRVNADGHAFALSENKFDPKKQAYKTAELYELGATPLGRRLGITEVEGKTIDEAVNSDLWLAFLRGDKKLLMDYRRLVNEEMARRNYNSPNDSMGVYLGSEQEKPSMRALFVDDLYVGSGVGGSSLLNSHARLVGVRSRIAEGDAQSLVAQGVLEEAKRLRATADSLESLVTSH